MWLPYCACPVAAAFLVSASSSRTHAYVCRRAGSGKCNPLHRGLTRWCAFAFAHGGPGGAEWCLPQHHTACAGLRAQVGELALRVPSHCRAASSASPRVICQRVSAAPSRPPPSRRPPSRVHFAVSARRSAGWVQADEDRARLWESESSAVGRSAASHGPGSVRVATKYVLALTLQCLLANQHTAPAAASGFTHHSPACETLACPHAVANRSPAGDRELTRPPAARRARARARR